MPLTTAPTGRFTWLRLEPDELEPVAERLTSAVLQSIESQPHRLASGQALDTEEIIRIAAVGRRISGRLRRHPERFRADVLAIAASRTFATQGVADTAMLFARDLVFDNLDELGSPEGRRRLLRAIIRRVVHDNLRQLVADPLWRAFVAVASTAADEGAALTALREADESRLQRLADFYRKMGDLLGFRLRPGHGSYEQLATTATSIIEGFALRHRITPAVIDEPLTIDDDEWHLCAAVYAGAIESLIEIDEEYDATEQLMRVLRPIDLPAQP